jgi:hypothetical protein
MQQQHGIPLSEVATRLGVSTDVIRKRVRRGTLQAYKGEDGRWYAVLDSQDSRLGQNGQSDSEAGRTVQVTVSSPPPGEDHAREAELLRQFLVSKDQEIEFLRNEMSQQREQWAEESRRKDVILHELSTQLKALPAAIIEEQQTQQELDAPIPPPAPRRPWWKFWVVDPM